MVININKFKNIKSQKPIMLRKLIITLIWLFPSIILFIYMPKFAPQMFSIVSHKGNLFPHSFPRLVSALQIIFAVLFFVTYLKDILVKSNTKNSTFQDEKNEPDISGKRVIIMIVILFLYLVMLESLGFIISTIVILLIVFPFFGYHNILRLIVISFITPFAIQYIFQEIFRMGLP